jgi:hypothetical protein
VKNFCFHLIAVVFLCDFAAPARHREPEIVKKRLHPNPLAQARRAGLRETFLS